MISLSVRIVLFTIATAIGFVFTFGAFFLPGTIVYFCTNNLLSAIMSQAFFILGWVCMGIWVDKARLEQQRIRKLEENKRLYEGCQ